MQTEIAHTEALTLLRSETKAGNADRDFELVEGPKTRWEKENSGHEDPQLIQALREGREEAFTALIARYHSTLIRLAKAFVPSQAIAEEVVQETWMGVLKGIGRFEGRSSFKTWICRILTNRAKTRGRRDSVFLVDYQENGIPPRAMGRGWHAGGEERGIRKNHSCIFERGGRTHHANRNSTYGSPHVIAIGNKGGKCGPGLRVS